jgi:hypothetical protein
MCDNRVGDPEPQEPERQEMSVSPDKLAILHQERTMLTAVRRARFLGEIIPKFLVGVWNILDEYVVFADEARRSGFPRAPRQHLHRCQAVRHPVRQGEPLEILHEIQLTAYAYLFRHACR